MNRMRCPLKRASLRETARLLAVKCGGIYGSCPSWREVVSVHRKSEASHVEAKAGCHDLSNRLEYYFEVGVAVIYLRSSQIPELAGQADVGKERFRFFERVTPPFRPQLIAIPGLSEPPSLFGSEHSTAAHLTRGAPSIQMLFRPEEEHCASRKTNVVPPVIGRHRKMNDPLCAGELVARDFQLHRIAAITAGGIDDRILVKDSSDA